MSTLKPVSRTTLSEQVATQIVAMIQAGHWKPGQRLPSESDLCQAFHIGRSTLREALKSLAFVGMVRMRVGEGTYVAERPDEFLDRVFGQDLLKGEKDLNDLCETRMVLETELAALCAQRATEKDLQELERIVTEMQQSIHPGGEGFIKLDVDFHLAIATFSQNQVLCQLLRTIRRLLQELITKISQVPGTVETAYGEHVEILEALKQHNPRKARSAMRRHLRRFPRGYEVVLKGMESKFEAREDAKVLSVGS